jgi:hypothetical protein
MKLDEIATNPRLALTVMERYVNEGSPSGFTFINTTSEHTRPRGSVTSFHLAEVVPRDGVLTHNLGQIPLSLFTESSRADSMFVHPDMLGHPKLLPVGKWEDQLSWFEVEPTASPRTVRLRTEDPDGYVKLHYEGHLSRIVRQLTLKHAQAALETDRILASLIDSGSMPASFAYYREVGARVYQLSDAGTETYWGMVWRPAQVYGSQGQRIAYLVPAFSLFSQDCREPEANTVLWQLGEVHASNKVQFLVEELLFPLVRGYFAMILQAGLQGEWHAQNVVFGFDESWHCIATVLRDMESVDRDLPLMVRTGTSVDLHSYPYKCLERHGAIYPIRHSFMFDYKFGEYLLAPLVDHACGAWGIHSVSVDRVIVDLVMSYLDSLPSDFFPADGCWYKFADKLINQSIPQRPYVRLENPRFRASSFNRR